jgi:hypothetical protein
MSGLTLFDLGRISKEAKIWMIIIALAAVGGGIGLGYGINDWTRTKPTTINVTVSSGFGVSIVDGATEIAAFDPAYSCGLLGMITAKISQEDFNSIEAYLKANPTFLFTPDDALTVTGREWHPFSLDQEMVSEDFFSLGSEPDVSASFDGKSHKFDFGTYAVILPMF